MRKLLVIVLSLIGAVIVALGIKFGMLAVIRGFAGQI